MKLTFGEIKKLFADNSLTVADDELVVGINRDSRAVQSGEIYVAIKGERFDGHDFLDQAFDRGAVAALVENRELDRPNLIYVEDVIKAMGKLAHYYRSKFEQPVIAITGSSGKTTTKDLLAAVLSLDGKVVATEGNLNNHIGVPLTVFKFCDDAKYFIVEMGMNHLEEIRYLTKMVNPDMALVTSVGLAHLEGVGGTLDNVAQAKGELFYELRADGVAFVYADDPHIYKMQTKAKRVLFGLKSDSEIWAGHVEKQEGKSVFMIHDGQKELSITINMVGVHYIQNVLAVYAIARKLGIDEAKILKGLKDFKVQSGRGQKIKVGNKVFIDDTYNANPESMHVMLKSLCEEYPDALKVAVLGDMLELGADAPRYHKEVGKFCRQVGVGEVFAYGDNALQYLKGFGYEESEIQKRFFRDQAELAQALKDLPEDNSIVFLLKGSRGMTMEKVLEYLKG